MEKIYLKWSSRFFAILMIPLLLLLFTGIASAQNKRYNITGKVTEGATKDPIPGAVVKILNTSLTTSTTANGSYSFAVDLSAGKYQIQISYVGYKTLTQTVDLGSSD